MRHCMASAVGLSLLLAFAIPATPGDDEVEAKAIAAAVKKLQGTWRIVSVESPKGGKLEGFGGQKVTFTGERYVTKQKGAGETETSEGVWNVVAVKGKLVHLDQQPGKGEELLKERLKGQALPSILEFLDGDTFRQRVQISGTIRGNVQRPVDFDTDLRTKGLYCYVRTFKRDKK